MDKPRKGCLYIKAERITGPDEAARFYFEMSKTAGNKRFNAVIIDISGSEGKNDGFIAYGLICGIEEFRERTLKIAVINDKENALENYFRDTMSDNRGISCERFKTVDEASEWIE